MASQRKFPRIQADGKLDEWCNDNIDWLQETFGKENVVSAVLHMDEKTPHIHATVVPVASGERRKIKEEKKTDEAGKLHSTELDRSFEVKDAKLQLLKLSNKPAKIFLSVNGRNILDWFKHKFQELKQVVRPHIKSATPNQNKGRGI